MTEPTTTARTATEAKAARSTAKPPPAWLISASMFALAVVTIVLVVTGQ
jgi:hypothetical protein